MASVSAASTNRPVRAAVYYVLSRRLHVLGRRPISCGTACGGVVYGAMNFAVVPLSAVAKRPFAPGRVAR
jgi:hypothetical protein